ncbi:bifunctional 2-polyprenyl-6-hydroxyphenol methylase/3-demethylubiquinol 3-O-methyltransferase UbiG [Arcobacter sp. LA11]|uniref:class I SAM-dependent methyltransferase n=1 Tax=Arcobacter sp. LA11 TaxID=1898176 RepID=UPI000934934C|nr:class I SAM-dependent methyltransferase [Arcobacter sp. LA11]
MKFDDIDFNELYVKQKQDSTFKMKSQDAWDKKAPSMNKKVHNSIYNDELLALVNTNDCESLLDVGCGVGNLSLKLATKLKEVNSLDYSSGMLDILKENANEQNLTNIKTINKSWYDSWEEVPKCDIVIASRSMEVVDMKEALSKLDSQAKKRVYLSYKVGGSFLSNDILNAMKREIIKKPDYIYLINILYSMKINASVNFVRSEGRSTVYTSQEDFIKSVSWSIGDISDIEKERLITYYNEKIKDKEESIDYVKWAVISWEK